MKNKLIEIISDAVVQCRFIEASDRMLSPVEAASIIANRISEERITILPEGSMVLTRKELDALTKYDKRRRAIATDKV